MSNATPKVQYPGLRGSEQHHDLKDEAGEKADPDRAEEDGTVSEDMKAAIDDSDDETGMADAMKRAVSKDEA